MPFDGALSPERMRAVQAPKIEPTPEAPADPYAFARQSLDAFLAEAQQSVDLSDDQKALLASVREDPRLQRLDEVVYTDPNGQAYRFRDYFAGHPSAERALKDVGIALQRYKDAFDKANAVTPRFEAAWNGALDEGQRLERQRYAGPDRQGPAPAVVTPGWEASVQAAWRQYSKATSDHLASIRASLDRPLPGAASYAALEARRNTPLTSFTAETPAPLQSDRPIQPWVGEKNALPPLPGQVGYEEMMSARIKTPDSIARPDEVTMVTPSVPVPRQSFLSRLKARFLG